ncbi:MAG: cyclic nucleotide-binding/CBS domain-containing protein [Nitrososphaerales archaeon]
MFVQDNQTKLFTPFPLQNAHPMKVREIMRQIISVDSAATAYDASQLMMKYYSGCILVENNKTVIGIITERDFMRVVTKERASPAEIKVYQVMSKPLKTIGPDATVEQAMKVMRTEKIRRLPVLEKEQFIGIVEITDILDVALGKDKDGTRDESQARRRENITGSRESGQHLVTEVTKIA